MELKQIQELINNFVQNELPRLQRLENYYVGKTNILKKKNRNEEIEDTKAVHNYAKYISTVATAYFLGKPITYNLLDVGKENDFNNLSTYLTSEEEQEENYSHASNCSIFGKSYELWYMGLDRKINGVVIDPRTMFVVRDNTINKNIIYAIRFQITQDKDTQKNYLEVYDNTNIYTYQFDVVSNVVSNVITDVKRHFFNKVPVVEFSNNSRQMGDFEDVITLIDAYDEAVSTSVDDLKDFSDAYLLLKNMSGTDKEDIKSLKENKVLLVDEYGDAKWLIKEVNDNYSQNIKNRLNQDIHKFSFAPDMTDKEFAGNSSGVALGFKLLPLEQLASQKEMYFKKAINKRLELIIEHNNYNITPQDIQKVFTRNKPQNLVEIANVVATLQGVVSQETLLSTIPFVEDAKGELEKIKAEDKPDDYTNLAGEEDEK